MEAREKFVVENLKGKILDIGFVACTLHQRVLEHFPSETVFGLDVEPVQPNGRYKQGSAEEIPFESGFFDSVLAGELIEHLNHPSLFVKESNRVLKKGGRLLITTPNRKSLINRLTRAYHAPLHFSLFSIPELKQLLEQQGFEVQLLFCLPYTEESSPGSRHKWTYGIRKALHFFLPTELREEIVVLAEKKRDTN